MSEQHAFWAYVIAPKVCAGDESERSRDRVDSEAAKIPFNRAKHLCLQLQDYFGYVIGIAYFVFIALETNVGLCFLFTFKPAALISLRT